MKSSLHYTALSFVVTLAACSSVTETNTDILHQRQELSEEMIAEDELSSEQPLQRTAAPAKVHVAKEKKATGYVSVASRHLPKSEVTYGASSATSLIRHVPQELVDRENYQTFEENGLKMVANQPVSTFSIDVDTGSYSNVRRFLNQGQLPREDAVRVEELVNYFNYGYQAPDSENMPFSVYTELAPSPWNADSKLLHIGLQGYEVEKSNLPPANLVFLIDVSGSMNSPDKIGLLKQGFKLLTNQLRPQDSISIAVYAGASGVVLEPTPGDQKQKILLAIDNLTAGGSTNGAAGINLAYQLAQANFKKEGVMVRPGFPRHFRSSQNTVGHIVPEQLYRY